jgi:hypothetical protein
MDVASIFFSPPYPPLLPPAPFKNLPTSNSHLNFSYLQIALKTPTFNSLLKSSYLWKGYPITKVGSVMGKSWDLPYIIKILCFFIILIRFSKAFGDRRNFNAIWR